MLSGSLQYENNQHTVAGKVARCDKEKVGHGHLNHDSVLASSS